MFDKYSFQYRFKENFITMQIKAFLTLFAFSICSNEVFGQSILLQHVNVITMSDSLIRYNQDVFIQDGKITKIAQKIKPKRKQKVKILSLKGKYIMPGLVDMHVHLKTEKELEDQLLYYLAAGVTGIRVMDSKSAQNELTKKVTDNHITAAPELYLSYIIRREYSYSQESADSLMSALKTSNYKFVKLFSLSNDSTFQHLMNSSKKYGVIVCGHYPIYRQFSKAIPIDFDKVLNSNFKSIEHLGGYTQLPDDKIALAAQQTKANNIFNCPTIDWDIMAYDLMYPNEYKQRFTYSMIPKNTLDQYEQDYLTNINKAGGNDAIIDQKNKYLPTYQKKINILKNLYQYKCPLLIGGDAGNLFQMDGFNIYEEMTHWSQAGIDNFTILQSATINPSLFFEELDKNGTIEEGKSANLIVLEKNPLDNIRNIKTIQYTFKDGMMFENAILRSKLGIH